MSKIHKVSNVNIEDGIGVCSICGNGTKVRLTKTGHWRCVNTKKPFHRISKVDEVGKRGCCLVCGEVRVFWRSKGKGKWGWKCSVKEKQEATEKRRKGGDALKSYHREYNKNYQKDEEHRAKARQAERSWRLKTPEYQKERKRKMYANDICFKLRVKIRGRIHQATTGVGIIRPGSAVRDLGCTIPELKIWLESKFHPNPETGEPMAWENHAYYGWHVDHIKPLASFDLSDREQFLEAVHYTNLQPLWWKENLKKSDHENNMINPNLDQ